MLWRDSFVTKRMIYTGKKAMLQKKSGNFFLLLFLPWESAAPFSIISGGTYLKKRKNLQILSLSILPLPDLPNLVSFNCSGACFPLGSFFYPSFYYCSKSILSALLFLQMPETPSGLFRQIHRSRANSAADTLSAALQPLSDLFHTPFHQHDSIGLLLYFLSGYL